MNRNTESRFSEAPQVNIQRSRFPRHCNVKTSFNVGQLIPFFVDEVLPGDTFEVKTSKVFRMQTLKTPIMDNLYLDTYFFYVPNRIVWEHWQNFLGENSDSAWIPANEYTVPQLISPQNGWNVGTIADYMGIPPKVDNLSINALPFRAYAMICDQFFRDENLSDPLVINTGDSTLSGSNGSNYISDTAAGGAPFVAAKMHDYFTSCLPAPQKGPDVQLPFTQGATLPVFTISSPNSYFDPKGEFGGASLPTPSSYLSRVSGAYPLAMAGNIANRTGYNYYPGFISGSSSFQTDTTDLHFRELFDNIDVDVDGLDGPVVSHTISQIRQNYNGKNIDKTAFTPVNLVADGNALSAFTSINQIREAFQIQRFFEKNARGGSRYRELIATHFQTSIGDVRSMIPEYLGGNRLPLNVRQITQTSSNVEGQPLGDVAGMSVTNDNHFDFIKSFTEHGYIIGLMCARYKHTYQQGIEPTFMRKTKFNYYWPVFAHIGEQPVRNYAIFAQGYDSSDSSAVDYDSQVFGYQEAWADYRYKFDRVSGMMRTISASGLDTWHFADSYAQLPTLSDSWIREDKSNVDRTLTVSSNVSDQIFADILVTNYTTRPMPLYSIPGLVDHF